MPRPNSVIKRLLFLGRGWDEWDTKALPEAQAQPAPKQKSGRRFATTLSFSALFFAGLALSAGAGNSMHSLLDGTDATSSSTAQTTLTAAEVTPAQPVHAVVHVGARQTGVRAVAAHVSHGSQLHAVQKPSGVRSAVPTPAGAVHVQARHARGRSVAGTVAGARAKKPAHSRAQSRPRRAPSSPSPGTPPAAGSQERWQGPGRRSRRTAARSPAGPRSRSRWTQKDPFRARPSGSTRPHPTRLRPRPGSGCASRVSSLRSRGRPMSTGRS